MADKDVTTNQVLRELCVLRSHVQELEEITASLQLENASLRLEIQQLRDQIARLKKNSSNSSKPPSSDIVKPKKHGTPHRKGKRKIGCRKGHPRHERIPFAPEDIDRTIPHELSAEQSKGLIPLDEWFVLQQVDLADKLYVVTEHCACKYLPPMSPE